MYVCMYVCMYACMYYLFIYLCLFVCMYVRVDEQYDGVVEKSERQLLLSLLRKQVSI